MIPEYLFPVVKAKSVQAGVLKIASFSKAKKVWHACSIAGVGGCVDECCGVAGWPA